MQVAGLKIGGQLVAEELFIILVLFLATEKNPTVTAWNMRETEMTGKSVHARQTAARAASSTSIKKSASALVMHKGGLIRRVLA